jgi:hypothetical protein
MKVSESRLNCSASSPPSAAAVAWSFTARAQQPVPVIGFLHARSSTLLPRTIEPTDFGRPKRSAPDRSGD